MGRRRQCGSGLARDAGASGRTSNRSDAIAGKPAPTQARPCRCQPSSGGFKRIRRLSWYQCKAISSSVGTPSSAVIRKKL
ncbi:hypothetical protein GDV60_21830 [Pseudomonas sp. DTU12.1]|nr:hypothetical protein GDV60_21830 [Pseudomonas sp. DTU12.1]